MTTHATTRPTTDPKAPGTSRAAWPSYLAILAGGVLLLKATLIIGNDGELNDTVAGVLYLGGLLLALVSAVGTGLQARRGLRTVTAVVLSVLIVAWVMGLGDLTAPAFEAVKDEAYVGDEAPIGLLGLVLLAAGLWRTRRG